MRSFAIMTSRTMTPQGPIGGARRSRRSRCSRRCVVVVVVVELLACVLRWSGVPSVVGEEWRRGKGEAPVAPLYRRILERSSPFVSSYGKQPSELTSCVARISLFRVSCLVFNLEYGFSRIYTFFHSRCTMMRRYRCWSSHYDFSYDYFLRR